MKQMCLKILKLQSFNELKFMSVFDVAHVQMSTTTMSGHLAISSAT